MDPQDRLFGEIAVRLQLMSREQVAQCMKAKQGADEGKRIGEVALARGFMSRDDVELVMTHQARVLERRRDAQTGKRAAVPRVVEDVAPKRTDRRTEDAVPVAAALEAADAAQKRERSVPIKPTRASAATVPLPPGLLAPPPAANSGKEPAPAPRKSLGATLIEPAVPPPPDAAPANAPRRPPPPALDDTVPDDVHPAHAPTRPMSLDDTRPLPPQGARPEEYDFATPARTNTGTLMGASRPVKPPASLGGTMLQASGAAAKQADRGWRNPSAPPLDVVQPPAAKTAAAQPMPASSPAAADGGDTAKKTLPQGDHLLAALATTPTPRHLDGLLARARHAGASDLHVHAGAAAAMRIDGVLETLTDTPPLSAAAAHRHLTELMSEGERDAFARLGELRFAYEAPDIGRFRVHAYQQDAGVCAVFRVLAAEAPRPEQLGLPARLQKLVEGPSGLMVCAGPSGAGKSSTLAALVRALTESRSAYAVSIEAPIEIVQSSARGLCIQVEVPTHAPSFVQAVDAALAQGASVIAIDEIDDASSLRAALRAADAGACVIATLRADGGAAAVARMLSLLPAQQHELLASVLRLVSHQILVPQASGKGRVAAVELLPCSVQVAEAIRDGALDRVSELLRSSKLGGIRSQRDALDELVQRGVIAARAAKR